MKGESLKKIEVNGVASGRTGRIYPDIRRAQRLTRSII